MCFSGGLYNKKLKVKMKKEFEILIDYSKFTCIGATIDKSNAIEESSSAKTRSFRYIDQE